MNSLRLVGLIFLISVSAVCQSDTTMKIRRVFTQSPSPLHIQNPHTSHTVYYRSGAMRKKETLDNEGHPTFSEIVNCETMTGFLIDIGARQYRTYKVAKLWPPEEIRKLVANNPKNIIHLESRTIDTGERKSLFGHSARHFVTTITRETQNGNGGDETIDGWYIDHESPDFECSPSVARTDPSYVVATPLVEYPEFPEFHHAGPVPTGFGVQVKRILRKPDQSGIDVTTTFEEAIESLSDSPVQSFLFQLPTDLKENPQLLRGK